MKKLLIFSFVFLLTSACAPKNDLYLTGVDISLEKADFKNASFIFFAEAHNTPLPRVKTVDVLLDYNTKTDSNFFSHVVFEHDSKLQYAVDKLQAEITENFNNSLPEEEIRQKAFASLEKEINEINRRSIARAESEKGLAPVDFISYPMYRAYFNPVIDIALYNARYGYKNGRPLKILFTDEESFVNKENSADARSLRLRNLNNIKALAEILLDNPQSKVAVFCGLLHLMPTGAGGNDYSLQALSARYLKDYKTETVYIFGGPVWDGYLALNNVKNDNLYFLPNEDDFKKIKGERSSYRNISRAEYEIFCAAVKKDFMRMQNRLDKKRPADWVFYFKTDALPKDFSNTILEETNSGADNLIKSIYGDEFERIAK